MKTADTDTWANPRILSRVEEKKKRLDTMRPLSPDVVGRLKEEFRVVHTYNSNAIEGNTLTLKETRLVVEEGITVGGKALNEHLEAAGNARAFDLIEESSQEKTKIDHIMVQRIHEAVSRGQLEDAGRYRTTNVRIAGTKVRPPSYPKILGLMEEYFEHIEQMQRHPLETATYVHHHFVNIHPFSDGNGRVGRLVMNLYLMQRGYPPIVLKMEDRKKYYWCLEKADGGDMGPMADMIVRAQEESLMIYLGTIGGKDELLPLEKLTGMCEYSQEYLSLRARQGALDAVKIGRSWHSTRNALEEYIRIHGSKSK